MFKIAAILPDNLVSIVQSAADELGENITIKAGSMNRAINLAKSLEQSGHDVIIARGGTELLLQQSGIKIPIVAVPITTIDIFNTICEAESRDKRFAVVAFDNMVSEIVSYEKIKNTILNKYLIKKEEEVAGIMKRIAHKGIKLVVGGGVISAYAALYQLKVVVIQSGKEAFIKAIQEAKRIALATKQEKENGQQFKVIVDNVHSGIISVDINGYIKTFNKSAENLLDIKNIDALGRRVQHLIPEIELEEILDTKREEIEIIKGINKELIVSKIPIVVNNEVVGGVAILQEASRIQQMEEKIRRESISVGHVAKYTFRDIIGVSKEVKELIRISKEYAKVNCIVLIEGETGTGKELMAQSIHNYSQRSSFPFVAVNCAAIPENLLESELFGYSSGAFTGADKKGKKGLFELAHNGTIFLDEISEMAPLLQGKLLRVLQEKQVMRIGDNRVIPINTRVIAATNQNLVQQVKAGRFREDLYYRLDVLKLTLVPLRNRRDDIPHLIEFFLNAFIEQHFKSNILLDEEAIDYLYRYNWPGNIRELKNSVERLVVMSKINRISLEDVKKVLPFDENLYLDTSNKQPLLIEAEQDTIRKALLMNQGSVVATAKELGISRTTLWRKMKKYKIYVSE